MDSTIPLLSKSKISSLKPSSVTVQSICVGPGWNPKCWFSHAQAHVFLFGMNVILNYLTVMSPGDTVLKVVHPYLYLIDFLSCMCIHVISMNYIRKYFSL